MAGRVVIKMDGVGKLGPQLKVRAKNFSERQVRAVQTAANEAAQEIEVEGRANIAAGGNFSSRRWQEGFQAKISFQSRTDLNIRVTHEVFYWRVFEFGATIHGKPLLWIPMPGSQAEQRKVRAREFGQPLFRVTSRRGNPILMTKGPDGKAVPEYFGKQQVRIPRKWHLRDIIKAAARRMNETYRRAMANNG